MPRLSRSAVLTEPLRRLVRGILPFAAFRLLSEFIDSVFALKVLGIREALRLHAARAAAPAASRALQTYKFRNLRQPLHLRPGTSDVSEAFHNIVREAYGKIRLDRPPRSIVDAGAYIGDTTSWFLSRYQDSVVLAIEPDPDSYQLLELNCQGYGNRAVTIEAALWPNTEELTLQRQANENGVRVLKIGENIKKPRCRSITPSQILQELGNEMIDVFKMDIEGAEGQLFRNPDTSWLVRISTLMIEIHGRENEDVVLDVMSETGFSHRRYRELHIFINQNCSRAR